MVSTGAGKTTIINLINRFYEIESGRITYDGIDIREIKKDDLRRSMAMVIQDTHLFTGTIRENIRYGRLDATDEEVLKAAKVANADSFIRRLPKGYDTLLYGDGSNLSQGQRQLLSIARAAIARPPVLILDEATSSIDTRTEALIEKGWTRSWKTVPCLSSPIAFLPYGMLKRFWYWKRGRSSNGETTTNFWRQKDVITSSIPEKAELK